MERSVIINTIVQFMVLGSVGLYLSICRFFHFKNSICYLLVANQHGYDFKMVKRKCGIKTTKPLKKYEPIDEKRGTLCSNKHNLHDHSPLLPPPPHTHSPIFSQPQVPSQKNSPKNLDHYDYICTSYSTF